MSVRPTSKRRRPARATGDALAIVLLVIAASRAFDADWVERAEASPAPIAAPAPLAPVAVAALDVARGHALEGRHERAVEELDRALEDGALGARERGRLLLAGARSERALGDWPATVDRLRAAVKADPDLVDPSAPESESLGAEVEALVLEATRAIPERQRVAPSDALASALRATYTLQRRLAGGCE